MRWRHFHQLGKNPCCPCGIAAGQHIFPHRNQRLKFRLLRLGFTLQSGSPGLDWANNIALGEGKVFVSGAAGGPMLGTVASGGFLDGYVLRLRVKDDD